jgi:hypothetical protein
MMVRSLVFCLASALAFGGSAAWAEEPAETNRFCDWADTLPLPDFEQVVQLSEHGWTTPAAHLQSELVAAKQRFPPKNRNATAIADDMIRLLIDPQFDDRSERVVIASLDGND